MSENTEFSARQGQVQVHFITNSEDIELPEEKRQLLVPTSMYLKQYEIIHADLSLRCTKIWPLPDPQFGGYA
jgi:hypothetical protein